MADGIYDKDPALHKDAVRYEEVSYHEVLCKGLKVMDAAATCICMENHMPIMVFKLGEGDSIKRAVYGEALATYCR